MPKDPIAYHSEEAETFADEQPLEEKPDAFIDLLDTFITHVGKGKVLDAGCGPGYETDYFAQHGLDAIGVDAAEGMIEYAIEHNNGTFHVMDLRNLDFEDNVFDGIWCNATMQFFPPDERETVLNEFDRVLTLDGILYTTFKMGDGSIVTEDNNKTIRRYLIPEKEARQTVKERGYEIIRTERSELKWGLDVLNMVCKKKSP